jgi:hypothetical protein
MTGRKIAIKSHAVFIFLPGIFLLMRSYSQF